MTALYFITSFVLVAALISLRAVKITAAGMSEFELKRRVEQHEIEAVQARERDAKLPDLLALRYLVDITLTAMLIGLLVYAWGFFLGVVAGLGIMLVIPKLSSTRFFGRYAKEWFKRNEEKLLEFAHRRHGLLRYLRQPSVSPQATPVHSREELVHVAEQTKNLLSEDELRLLESGLFFSGKHVKDVMTDKEHIKHVNQDDVMGPVVLDELHKSKHTIFPVIKKDIDHVVGMLHMRDIDVMPRQLTTVKRYMQPKVCYIRMDDSLEQAMHGFLHSHQHLFIVINELRGTVGVISLADVIEALFGRTITKDFSDYQDIREVAVSKRGKEANQQ